MFGKKAAEKLDNAAAALLIAVVLAACGCGADRGYGCPRCGRCFCNAPCGCGHS